MKKSYQKGFTLIELLVVIAIIGILSSVVLASLNSARAKGANAAIKANLANMRAQAELYYSDNNNYGSTPATSCSSGMFAADTTIAKAIAGADAASGGPNSACQSNPQAWAISEKLKVAEGTNTHWCVDSTGNSKGQAGSIVGPVCL